MTVPMNKMIRVVLTAIVSMVMAAVISCKEEAPSAPPAQIVNKKIAIQQSKPTEPAPTPAAAPAKGEAASQPTPAAAPAKGEAASQPATAAAPAGETQAKPADAAPVGSQTNAKPADSKLVEESRTIAMGYNPEGRFDPFEPLFRDESGTNTTQAKGKRKKRKPQTPLERVAISQLKLSAVMRTTKGNSAIVEDATGKGYVIKHGTYVGLNSGQVVKIDKDRVVIEEEIENIMGEFVIQNTELKLQKPAGEL
jgi:type IV pilus assembly protein PilP